MKILLLMYEKSNVKSLLWMKKKKNVENHKESNVMGLHPLIIFYMICISFFLLLELQMEKIPSAIVKRRETKVEWASGLTSIMWSMCSNPLKAEICGDSWLSFFSLLSSCFFFFGICVSHLSFYSGLCLSSVEKPDWEMKTSNPNC